jgi:hypothetical protein
MVGRFKLVQVIMGSGWPSGHVALDEYYSYRGKAGGAETLLNLETCTSEELEDEIDLLIAELEAIKLAAPSKFEQWLKEADLISSKKKSAPE